RSWSDIKKMTPENRAKILPYSYQWTETAEGLSGEEVYPGFAQMDAMRNAALAASKGFDFIISPTAPVPTYPAACASPATDPQRPFYPIVFSLAMNVSEHPAISTNCGSTSKALPTGLQIFSQRFDYLGV